MVSECLMVSIHVLLILILVYWYVLCFSLHPTIQLIQTRHYTAVNIHNQTIFNFVITLCCRKHHGVPLLHRQEFRKANNLESDSDIDIDIEEDKPLSDERGIGCLQELHNLAQLCDTAQWEGVMIPAHFSFNAVCNLYVHCCALFYYPYHILYRM